MGKKPMDMLTKVVILEIKKIKNICPSTIQFYDH